MPPSGRFFTRRLVSRTVYRDDRGRFISREEGVRTGRIPQTQRFYEFRDNQGRRRSREFVQRQRQRVITITQAGDLIRRESASTARQVQEMVPAPSFQTIQSQRFRSIFNEFNDRLYELSEEQAGDLERFFTEMEYEYIRIFEPLTGGVYLQLLHAESPDAEIFDFDSLTTAPMGIDDEELQRANEEFRNSVQQIWRRYFG